VSRFPNARFLVSAATVAQFPADRGFEIAFTGRSNAGKSSAINALTERRSLARVSKTPGRTRLLNFFELAADRRLVDLPGYGYARVSDEERRIWAELIGALWQRASMRGALLIADARRGVLDEDLALIEWSQNLPVHVLLSKSDKLSRSEATAILRAAQSVLAGGATVQLFSAVSKAGVEEAQRVLESWWQ
jgi:GTP-binding protein